MKFLENIFNVYFVGIGGIGMSVLVCYVLLLGKLIYGYDKIFIILMEELLKEGMKIIFKDLIFEILKELLKDNMLVVYILVIFKDSVILNYFIFEGFEVVKCFKLLGEVIKNMLCLVVVGIYGKIMILVILGYLMVECNMLVIVFLGGIVENYNFNFISKGIEIIVVEVDEFDCFFF